MSRSWVLLSRRSNWAESCVHPFGFRDCFLCACTLLNCRLSWSPERCTGAAAVSSFKARTVNIIFVVWKGMMGDKVQGAHATLLTHTKLRCSQHVCLTLQTSHFLFLDFK